MNRKEEERVVDEYEPDIEAIKAAINNLLWMYAPAGLSLGSAESRACAVLMIVSAAPGKFEGDLARPSD